MCNLYAVFSRKQTSITRAVFTLTIACVFITGCASRTLDRSFDRLSASIDQFTRTVAPPDTPRNCAGGPRDSLELYVRFNGSCPAEVLPKENGCGNQKSKNVVCVCRNKISSEPITWQSIETDPSGVISEIEETYSLYFDPFNPNPSLEAIDGKIEATLPDAPPVKSPRELIAFKYTIYKANCDPVDPRIIIGE